MRIALIQMDIKTGDPVTNLPRAVDLIKHCVDLNPDIVLLPELFTTGFTDKIPDLAETMDGETVRALKELANENDLTIIGSFPEREADHLYNSMPVVTPDGIAGVYRKIHLFGGMDEQRYFTPGSRPGFFRAENLKAGLMICYDIRFPELARKITLLGADVILVSAEFPDPRINHWRTLLQARAIENQVFVCAVNRVGTDGNNTFFGHSMVVSPWGEIIVEGRGNEEILIADLDLEEVREARESLPVLEDRREDVYRLPI